MQDTDDAHKRDLKFGAAVGFSIAFVIVICLMAIGAALLIHKYRATNFTRRGRRTRREQSKDRTDAEVARDAMIKRQTEDLKAVDRPEQSRDETEKHRMTTVTERTVEEDYVLNKSQCDSESHKKVALDKAEPDEKSASWIDSMP